MSRINAEEYKTFEGIKQVDESGEEFWYARELAIVLEYTQWRNFSNVVDKAMIACKNSGYDLDYHFAEVSKMIIIGKGAHRSGIDFKLSRYACYLIVQNGDPRKEIIARGQTYFALQTRRQEVADYFNQLDEDNKRLVIRGDVKLWNQMLAEAAHNAGVMTNEEYSQFQNEGYKGLYDGMVVADIHAKKDLKKDEKILDFMGSEELAANLFRITQTESKLKRENIKGVHKASRTHYSVGKEVRKAIENIGGTMPENLPTPSKNINEIEREEIKKLKILKKKLMLDE
jgi:DNA-damage-inducible protein D